MAFAPIFIIGVPRSGTTLLRVLLDSHSEIAGLPETPWLLGAYGADTSLRSLLTGLIEGPYGAVRNVTDIAPQHVFAAGRSLLETLFEPVLKARNKSRLAFKTPADIRHLDVLLKLVPDAYYIHITRDGRDVAMSQLGKKGTFFEDNLKEYRRLSFANLLRRWAEWEARVRSLLYRDGIRAVHVRYEDLTADPERELRRIMAFLGVPFEAGMLDYAKHRHDYPSWEAGSTDVARHDGIAKARTPKWRQVRLTGEMVHALRLYDPVLAELGYARSDLKPGWAERTRARVFPLINPALDWVAALRLKARPLLKNRARISACVALLLLAVQFLVPGDVIPGLTADIYQPLLCFAVALGMAGAFGTALLRSGGSFGSAFLKMTSVLWGILGLLERAQTLVPGRAATPGDFLMNAAATAAAVAIGIAVVRGRSRAQEHDVAPQTRALSA